MAQRDERYRPSPRALGFPEPSTELEGMLQLVRTGHRQPQELPAAVLDTTLYVYAFSPGQRTVVGIHDRNGRVLVQAYTSKTLVPQDWPHARAVLGRDLAELLDGCPVVINPDELVTVVVPFGHLHKALVEERGR